MSDEATLSAEEMAVVESFRQRMATPNEGTNEVQVVNESLGQLLDGTKIQFRPGEGKPLKPALRGQARWAARERRRLEALEAAEKREKKGKDQGVLERVAEQSKKIEGRNAQDTLEYILSLSIKDREYAVLAEEQGQNRATVLRTPGLKVGARTREEFNEAYAELTDLITE